MPIEHTLRVDRRGRRNYRLLQLLIPRNLREHLGEIRLRVDSHSVTTRPQQAVAVAPRAALVPQRDEVEVRAHPQVALHLLPLAEVLLVRSALDGLARRDRVELEELEDAAQHRLRLADEFLVREDMHALELVRSASKISWQRSQCSNIRS